MVSQVTFTKRASRHLISIITYIDQKFGDIAVQEFGELLSAAVASLQKQPGNWQHYSKAAQCKKACNS